MVSRWCRGRVWCDGRGDEKKKKRKRETKMHGLKDGV